MGQRVRGLLSVAAAGTATASLLLLGLPAAASLQSSTVYYFVLTPIAK
jgi:hypothetical protein